MGIHSNGKILKWDRLYDRLKIVYTYPNYAVVAQSVEHFPGKEEVGSSILLNSSIINTIEYEILLTLSNLKGEEKWQSKSLKETNHM